MLQSLLLADGAYERSVSSQILLVSIYRGIKIGLDLEEFTEVGILCKEKLVDERFSDQDDLDTEWYWLGSQALSANEP